MVRFFILLGLVNYILVVRAIVPRMILDELFEQKGEVAKSVLEELEKVTLNFPDIYLYHDLPLFILYDLE